jgi:DNA-binding transcriptional regulator YhcF (GntR family)
MDSTPRKDVAREPVGRGSCSYKFQRLRDQLREAVRAGDLSGKLPGERELARRYRVNAKTVSKALTDLTSEGLLIRQVGRGTFVADQVDQSCPVGRARRFHWLVHSGITNGRFRGTFDAAAARLTDLGHRVKLEQVDPDEAGRLRADWMSPGRLRDVDGVVIHSSAPSDELIADLHRRHIPLVLAASTAESIKANAVRPDWACGAYELAEQFLWTGHRRIALAISSRYPLVRSQAERGYSAALARHGVAPLEPVDDTPQALASLAAGALRPSAVIVFQADSIPRVREAFYRRPGPAGGLPAIGVLLPPDAARPPDDSALSYGFDREAFVDWTVRLLLEATPGHQPREVVLPGSLTGLAARPQDSPGPKPRSAPDTTSL